MYMIVGAGKCGTSLLADFWATKTETDKRYYCTPVVVNSSVVDFHFAEKRGIPLSRCLGLRVPRPNNDNPQRVLLGTDTAFAQEIAGGMGNDFFRGNEVATQAKEELKEKLLRMAPVLRAGRGRRETIEQKIELAIVFFGLGGGTGSGATPVIGQVFQELGIPVFAVGVLPCPSEGDQYARNAYFSMKETIKHTDAMVLADNELIDRKGGAIRFYNAFNRFISGCVLDLFLRHRASMDASAKLGLPTNDYRNFETAVSLAGPTKTVKGVAVLGRATTSLRDLDRQGQNLREVLIEKAFNQMSLVRQESYKGESIFFQFTFHPSLAKGDFPLDKIKDEMRKQTGLTGLEKLHPGYNQTKLRIAKLAFAQVFRPENVHRIKDIRKQVELMDDKRQAIPDDGEDMWGYEAK